MRKVKLNYFFQNYLQLIFLKKSKLKLFCIKKKVSLIIHKHIPPPPQEGYSWRCSCLSGCKWAWGCSCAWGWALRNNLRLSSRIIAGPIRTKFLNAGTSSSLSSLMSCSYSPSRDLLRSQGFTQYLLLLLRRWTCWTMASSCSAISLSRSAICWRRSSLRWDRSAILDLFSASSGRL